MAKSSFFPQNKRFKPSIPQNKPNLIQITSQESDTKQQQTLPAIWQIKTQ